MARNRPEAGAPPVSLSTITVAWNSGETLRPFLRALERARAEAPFPIEVIIVDNASADGTADRIASEAPWVRLIRNDANLGFAEACNQGLAAAGSEMLLLLNPDCIANARALEGMVKFLEGHERVGATGCLLMHDDGLPQRSAHDEPSPRAFLFSNSLVSPMLEIPGKLRHRVLPPSRKPRRCAWLMGSALMVRRGVFEKVGGLEASYFMYCEDTDWCRRIREAGWQVVHLPGVAMTHSHKGSARRAAEFTFRRLFRSLLLYANRHMTPRERDRYCRALVLDLKLRQPLYRLLGLLRPGRQGDYAARIESCRRLIKIVESRNPDLFEDPPPGRAKARS